MNPISLVTVEPEQQRWLDPYIPLGTFTAAVGPAGVGKSTYLADRIAYTSRLPGRALVFTAEEHRGGVIRTRIEAQGGDLSRVLVDDQPFVLVENLHRLASMLQPDEPTLLVFDPLTAYLKSRAGLRLRAELQTLNGFCRHHHVAALAVVHVTKRATSVLSGARGGGELGEVCRQVLGLARLDPTNPGSPTLVAVAKSNLVVTEVPHTAFTIGPDPLDHARPHLRWLDDTELPDVASLDQLVAKATRIGRITRSRHGQEEGATAEPALTRPTPTDAERVLTYLRAYGCTDVRTIYRGLHMDALACGRATNELVAAGVVRVTGLPRFVHMADTCACFDVVPDTSGPTHETGTDNDHYNRKGEK